MGKGLYKVIFAEDEVPLRKAICQIMDWESMGFELAYEANDGQEALDYIEMYKPDVLLTDICMPLMDGLVLAKKVRERLHSMKIVILTGHDEFEYAQEALNLNVTKYILKPTTPQEFKEVMLKLKEELDAELLQKRNIVKYKQQYEESQKVLREKALLSLLTHRDQNLTYMLESCNRLGIDLNAKHYITAVSLIENKEEIAKEYWDGDYQLIDFAICNVCKEVLQEYNQDLVFLGHDHDVVIILKEKEMELRRFEDYCVDIMNEVKFNIKRVFNLELSVGIGDKYENFKEIPYSYQDALTALEYRILLGTSKIIVRSDIERKILHEKQKLDEWLMDLEHLIKTNDLAKVKQHLEYIFHYVKHSKMSITEFRTLLLKITVNILNVHNEIVQYNDQDDFVRFDIFNKVYHKENLDEVKSYYVELCETLIENIEKSRAQDQANLVTRAISYINNQYGNIKLDVQMVCEHLHVSTSYFSRLFKTETNETFVEYITRKRMEKAKELLKTSNMKVFEISQVIGYEDPHYFSYNFRKQTGMTPTEFRNSEGMTID